MAKKALAADLREDRSGHNDNIWTRGTEGIENVDREELVLVETLLTQDEYYEQYSGSDYLPQVISSNLQDGPICCT